MEVAEAFDLISHAIDLGSAASGYLLCGDLAAGLELTERVLLKLFPDATEQVTGRTHPDIAWLELEKRSGIISIDAIRTRLVEPMAQTAFSAGWKAGVLVGADRLNVQAANAFLKTLEEPTPKTIFFLLSDMPDGLLPTIVSRTQRIDLPLSDGTLDGEVFEKMKALFSTPIPNDPLEKALLGHQLARILGDLKDDVKDEETAPLRKAFYKTILACVRPWIRQLELYLAFRNIEAVEDAYRQSSRSMNDEAVLCAMTDRLTFPTAHSPLPTLP